MFTRLTLPLALVCAGFAQTPAFEVASVKPSEPITPAMVQSGRLQMGVTIDALNVRISKLSLFDLTRLAHQVKAHQIAGPSWMANQRYDIQAKLPEGAPRSQVPVMLQTLLAERFGMVYHRENREFTVYALVVAKNGPHLQPATEDPNPPAPAGQLRGGLAVAPGGATSSIGPNGNSRITPSANGDLHITTTRMTLPAFADLLNRYCDQPVIDMTDIKGSYDMEFDVSAEELRNAAQVHGMSLPRPAEGASDPSPVSLPSSLQKLGLKLESRKAPAEVIVIDKAEKVPTEN